jgi:hypothetical protein
VQVIAICLVKSHTACLFRDLCAYIREMERQIEKLQKARASSVKLSKARLDYDLSQQLFGNQRWQ